MAGTPRGAVFTVQFRNLRHGGDSTKPGVLTPHDGVCKRGRKDRAVIGSARRKTGGEPAFNGIQPDAFLRHRVRFRTVTGVVPQSRPSHRRAFRFHPGDGNGGRWLRHRQNRHSTACATQLLGSRAFGDRSACRLQGQHRGLDGASRGSNANTVRLSTPPSRSAPRPRGTRSSRNANTHLVNPAAGSMTKGVHRSPLPDQKYEIGT